MRLVLILVLSLIPGFSQLFAEGNCDSCAIVVKNLQEPIPLAGSWQFTRDDVLTNKDPGIDTSSWRIVRTPGAWKGVYADGKNFRVGWYRANFQFAPELVGQDVVVLVDTFMAAMRAYADGQLIFERGGIRVGEKYFAVQAVPLRFRITQENMVFALRVDSIIMTGIYQFPFQLRAYHPNDRTISAWQMFSGDLRVFSVFLCVISGLNFLLYYLKTRHFMYLLSSCALFGFLPFYAMVIDPMQTLIDPELNWCLHYPGIVLGTLYFNIFASYFHGYQKRWVILKQAVGWGVAIWLLYLAFNFDLDRMQVGRKLAIVISFFWIGHACWMYWRCLHEHNFKRKDVLVLFTSYLYLFLVGVHDLLIALGRINSVTLIFTGSFLVALAILFVSSTILADAFMQNKRLVVDLEFEVAERTKEIRVILDHVQHGFLLAGSDRKVASSFSASCRSIFQVEDPQNRDLADLLQFDANTRSLFNAAMRQVFENTMPPDVSLAMLPTRFVIQDQVYQLTANIIGSDSGEVERLLFSISNITQLEDMVRQNQKQLGLLKILANRESFVRFLSETRLCFDRARAGIGSAQAYLELHTIKGNALIFGLEDLAQLAHNLESNPRLTRADIDRLDRDLTAFLDASEPLLGLRAYDQQNIVITEADAKLLMERLDRKSNTDPLNEVKQFFHRARFKKAKDLLGIIPDQVAALSQSFEKNVELVVKGGETLMDPDRVSPVVNQLSHVLRNAIDHGIENREDRQDKNPVARIEIEFKEDPQNWIVHVSDDGRGLDAAMIEQRALEQGIIPAAERGRKTQLEIFELIFHPGFSTRTETSLVSGRGMGMTSLRTCLQNLGGTVSLESQTGQGTRFMLTWPKLALSRVA